MAYHTNNALVQTFGVDSLNELTTVSRSGTLTVAGTTTSAATNVTVNAQAATLYSDATFAKEGFSLADGNNTFTAIAKDSYGRQDTNVVTAWLPVSASYVYDLNGNLLSDGKRGFEYDDENQLVRVTVTNAWKSEFVYDGKMRRRVRKEYACQSGSYIQTNEVRYVYVGNLVVQERWYSPQVSTSFPQQVVSYTRGTDLSGSFEGAGGIGGLLARSSSVDLTYPHAYYHADGNGNVTALVSTNQLLVAKYLYDPYGNILSQSGPLAEANLYRFSSKEAHPNSGLVYYLYRYYEPGLQRWVNCDPLGEKGHITLRRGTSHSFVGANLDLNTFVNNDPMDLRDADGLIANILGECAAGAAVGGISGFIGGLIGAPASNCPWWKSAGCGALGGAISGCASSVICLNAPQWCTAGSCLAGALGNVAQQLCMGGFDPKNPCTWVSFISDSVLGCLGGPASAHDEAKAKLIFFLTGMDAAAITSLCH